MVKMGGKLKHESSRKDVEVWTQQALDWVSSHLSSLL
jgi:hypothetical protein